jgi:hypothetical protein
MRCGLSGVCIHTHGNAKIMVCTLLVVIETGCGFSAGVSVMLGLVEGVWWQVLV